MTGAAGGHVGAAPLTLVIGSPNYSSWSLRPWLFLAHHGIAFEQKLMPLYAPGAREAILPWSPTGKVPALAEGPVRLWESIAILEYLAERFPQARGWPASVQARAHARSVGAEMHAGFGALRSAQPMNVRRRAAPRDWPGEVQADIDRVSAIWNDCRARFGAEGPFLFGDFGIADCMFAPVVWRFRTYAVPLQGAAAQYRDTMLGLPAMRAWEEAARADPVVMPQYDSV